MILEKILFSFEVLQFLFSTSILFVSTTHLGICEDNFWISREGEVQLPILYVAYRRLSFNDICLLSGVLVIFLSCNMKSDILLSYQNFIWRAPDSKLEATNLPICQSNMNLYFQVKSHAMISQTDIKHWFQFHQVKISLLLMNKPLLIHYNYTTLHIVTFWINVTKGYEMS